MRSYRSMPVRGREEVREKGDHGEYSAAVDRDRRLGMHSRPVPARPSPAHPPRIPARKKGAAPDRRGHNVATLCASDPPQYAVLIVSGSARNPADSIQLASRQRDQTGDPGSASGSEGGKHIPGFPSIPQSISDADTVATGPLGAVEVARPPVYHSRSLRSATERIRSGIKRVVQDLHGYDRQAASKSTCGHQRCAARQAS
jgi:hypothetical protein